MKTAKVEKNRSPFVLLYITTSDRVEAERIGEALLVERLAACVNILGPILSIYQWKGRLERGREVAMLLKTRRALLDRATRRIEQLHSYEVPCVIALPISGGSDPFLGWLRDQTAMPRTKGAGTRS